MNYSLLILIVLLAQVYCHGYASYPIARQARCNKGKGYYYPLDGSGIKDPACRSAFQHVKSKGNDAVIQFQQVVEVAALAGSKFGDLNHIKKNVVPKNLCGANANGQDQFGDKTGLSIPANWTPTILANRSFNLEFCASAPHTPSFFEVYVSKSTYNPLEKELEWSDLEFHQSFDQKTIKPEAKWSYQGNAQSNCDQAKAFYLPIKALPLRANQFVIYVRWQRDDPVGEGFYNCIDVKYVK